MRVPTRISRWFFVTLLGAALTLPGVAAAQSAPTMTVVQARSAFSSAGYTLEAAHAWDWTRPPVTSFEVHGQHDDRILMVLVYPSMTAAQDALLQAESHEQALNPGNPIGSGSGPHLVSGFGASAWSGNVALVQTSQKQLERLYQWQADRDNGLVTDQVILDDPAMPTIAVDLDFLAALQSAVVNL